MHPLDSVQFIQFVHGRYAVLPGRYICGFFDKWKKYSEFSRYVFSKWQFEHDSKTPKDYIYVF